MVWFVVGLILLFDFVVMKVASSSSRLEEKMYLEEYKKNID